MKIVNCLKLLLLLSTLFFVSSEEAKKETEKTPIYETPFIRRNNSPITNNFNPRYENINLTGAEKHLKRKFQDAKDTFRANLIRDFSVDNLGKWATHLQKENINKMEEHDIIDNISSIKVYSRALQGKINELGNNLKTQVGLFDLVLKERKVLEEKIREIKSGNTSGICKRLEELDGNSKIASTALHQQVKDVKHEINRVRHSINKLEEDERNQKKIVVKKGDIKKLQLQGHYHDPQKKKEVTLGQHHIDTVLKHAKSIKESVAKRKEQIKKVVAEKKYVANVKQAKVIAHKIQAITKKLNKKLEKIQAKVATTANVKVAAQNKQQVQAFAKQIKEIKTQLQKVAPGNKVLANKIQQVAQKVKEVKKVIQNKVNGKLANAKAAPAVQKLNQSITKHIQKIVTLKRQEKKASPAEKPAIKAKIAAAKREVKNKLQQIKSLAKKVKTVTALATPAKAAVRPLQTAKPVVAAQPAAQRIAAINKSISRAVKYIVDLKKTAKVSTPQHQQRIKTKIQELKKEVKVAIAEAKHLQKHAITPAKAAVKIDKAVTKIRAEQAKIQNLKNKAATVVQPHIKQIIKNQIVHLAKKVAVQAAKLKAVAQTPVQKAKIQAVAKEVKKVVANALAAKPVAVPQNPANPRVATLNKQISRAVNYLAQLKKTAKTATGVHLLKVQNKIHELKSHVRSAIAEVQGLQGKTPSQARGPATHKVVSRAKKYIAELKKTAKTATGVHLQKVQNKINELQANVRLETNKLDIDRTTNYIAQLKKTAQTAKGVHLLKVQNKIQELQAHVRSALAQVRGVQQTVTPAKAAVRTVAPAPKRVVQAVHPNKGRIATINKQISNAVKYIIDLKKVAQNAQGVHLLKVQNKIHELKAHVKQAIGQVKALQQNVTPAKAATKINKVVNKIQAAQAKIQNLKQKSATVAPQVSQAVKNKIVNLVKKVVAQSAILKGIPKTPAQKANVRAVTQQAKRVVSSVIARKPVAQAVRVTPAKPTNVIRVTPAQAVKILNNKKATVNSLQNTLQTKAVVPAIRSAIKRKIANIKAQIKNITQKINAVISTIPTKTVAKPATQKLKEIKHALKAKKQEIKKILQIAKNAPISRAAVKARINQIINVVKALKRQEKAVEKKVTFQKVVTPAAKLDSSDSKQAARQYFMSQLALRTRNKKLDKATFNKLYNLFVSPKNLWSLSLLNEGKRRARIDSFISNFLALIKH